MLEADIMDFFDNLEYEFFSHDVVDKHFLRYLKSPQS